MRKKTEVSLQESEERFKALHNASFGGITIHDKGVILDCNKGLSDITGYSVEELIGMDGMLLIAEHSL
nr:PAS domain S-box protein [uncultured Sphaerochaeta sp.]